ncbi:MAG: ECF transporter S component [Eubacteriales bacterium]|nr:ECF transporter S component [Eubacteriales bacterium]
MKTQKQRMSTQTLVLGAILTALVIVLQLIANVVKVGPVALTLVQVPIIIGVATCGIFMGGWLGFVFAFTVLISGASEPFFTFNPIGTIFIVFAKGIACGMAAGLVYKLVHKTNRYVAVIAAAIICPIVNTGIFFLGCLAFYMPLVTEWANGANVGTFMLVGLAGFNFLFELGTNIVLSPVIVRLLNIRKINA